MNSKAKRMRGKHCAGRDDDVEQKLGVLKREAKNFMRLAVTLGVALPVSLILFALIMPRIVGDLTIIFLTLLCIIFGCALGMDRAVKILGE